MKIAVVPARGGSKRILRKNIRPFMGLPIISRVLAVLQQTELFDHILVSTDDEEIARIALAAGADSVSARPKELSDDFATTVDVLAYEANQCLDFCSSVAEICCIYPTAVLTTADDLRSAYSHWRTVKTADYCFAATEYAFPIQRAVKLTASGVEMFWPEHRLTRSQDLEPAYHDAGQFYWGTVAAWMQKKPIFAPQSTLFVIPNDRVQDIDTEADWRRAEIIFKDLFGV